MREVQESNYKGVNNLLCLGIHRAQFSIPTTLQVERRGHQMRFNGRRPKSVAGKFAIQCEWLSFTLFMCHYHMHWPLLFS